MLITQISVFVENKPGTLCEITDVLAKNDIDIRALSLADTTQFGILRLIVNNPEKAYVALQQAEIAVSQTQVIAVKTADTPGGLNAILQKLLANGVAVEYAYAFIARSIDDAFVILRMDDNEKALQVIEQEQISLLGPTEIYSI